MRPTARIRPAVLDDAAALAALYRESREQIAPFSPTPSPALFTDAGQRERLAQLLAARERGERYPFVIVRDGELVGTISLFHVVRESLQSGTVGFHVAPRATGQGVATAALAQLLDLAFGELGLHRVEAAVQPLNAPSLRVVEKNGFERIGLARAYLHVAAEWRDHLLYQRLAAEP